MDDASKNRKSPSALQLDTMSSTIFAPGFTVAIVFGSSSAANERQKPQYP